MRPALTRLLCLLLLVPWLGAPFDSSLCNNDNQTEVPPFALPRDGNQCLPIDPGNGDPPILFQFEEFHKRGVAESSCLGKAGCPGPGVTKVRDIFNAEGAYAGACSRASVGCRYLLWDNEIDAYLSNQINGEDLVKILGATKYTYFRNMRIQNGWRCNVGSPETTGTTTWEGPAGSGISCPATPTCASGCCATLEGCGTPACSCKHFDGIQTNDVPSEGGWIVIQDSSLMNAGNAQMIMSDKPSTPGGMLFQGFQSSRLNTRVGEAEHWIDDCEQSFHNAALCNNQVNTANLRIGARLTALWIVDSWGNTPFSNVADSLKDKVIIVNSGCNQNGCFRDAFNPTPNGSRAYQNGWPVPLLIPSTAGPGTCPNGLIATNPTGAIAKVYCYTSIENALADTTCNGCPHLRPPFLQHSDAGWQTPPAGATCDNDNVCESGEACSGTCLNGQTCATRGFAGGTLSCNTGCTFNTNDCTNPSCGNGALETGEACDDGVNNADSKRCTLACQWARCGDGKRCTSTDASFGCIHASPPAAVEPCDDGNTVQTDACLNTCVAASCGDGQVCSAANCDTASGGPGLEDCEGDAVCAPGTCSACQCIGGGTPGPAQGTFDVIDADTDAIMSPSPLPQSGAIINPGDLSDGSYCLNLDYVYGANTESVQFVCGGVTHCESSPPLTPGMDTAGDFNCWPYLATSGAKTCTAQPFAGNCCTGTAGDIGTWSFQVGQTPPRKGFRGKGVIFRD